MTKAFYWTILFDSGEDGGGSSGWSNVKGKTPHEALRSVVPFIKGTRIKKKALPDVEQGWLLIATLPSGAEEVYKAFIIREA